MLSPYQHTWGQQTDQEWDGENPSQTPKAEVLTVKYSRRRIKVSIATLQAAIVAGTNKTSYGTSQKDRKVRERVTNQQAKTNNTSKPFKSQDLISNSPYSLLYSFCDVSLENLVLDQLMIP